MKPRSIFGAATAAFALVLTSTLLTGCAGYHLGPVAPKFMDGVHTVAVPTFANDTLTPRLEVLAADTVIEQIQQDGTFKVASAATADVIIDGTIREIRRHGSSSVRSDVLRQSQYTLTVSIKYSAKKRSTGEELNSGTIIGSTSFFVSGNDVIQDERQAIPLALQDAAVHLVSQLSEGW